MVMGKSIQEMQQQTKRQAEVHKGHHRTADFVERELLVQAVDPSKAQLKTKQAKPAWVEAPFPPNASTCRLGCSSATNLHVARKPA
jgi:hypothetical protein